MVRIRYFCFAAQPRSAYFLLFYRIRLVFIPFNDTDVSNSWISVFLPDWHLAPIRIDRIRIFLLHKSAIFCCHMWMRIFLLHGLETRYFHQQVPNILPTGPHIPEYMYSGIRTWCGHFATRLRSGYLCYQTMIWIILLPVTYSDIFLLRGPDPEVFSTQPVGCIFLKPAIFLLYVLLNPWADFFAAGSRKFSVLCLGYFN